MTWHTTMGPTLAEPYLLCHIMSEKPASGAGRLQRVACSLRKMTTSRGRQRRTGQTRSVDLSTVAPPRPKQSTAERKDA